MTANLSQSSNNTVESSTTEMNHHHQRKPATKTSEHRRITKPIMEKKRRARINNSLNELKVLILDALNKDPSRHSKLEKADILEMTVRHLQKLQRQQVAAAIVNDPAVLNKYRAGFSECASEVGRYMGNMDNGFDQTVRQRILSHLNHCLNSLNQMAANAQFGTLTATTAAAVAGQKTAFPGMIPPGNPLHVNVFGRDINNNRTTGDETLKTTLSTPPSSASSTSSHFAFNLTSPKLMAHNHHPISLTTSQDMFSTSAYGKNISPAPSSSSSSSSSAGLSSPGSTCSMSFGSMMSPLGMDLAVDLATNKKQPDNVDDENVWRPW